MPKSARVQACNSVRRPLRSPALVARADFLKIGYFAPFSQFLHTKGLNFPDVFIRSRLPMTRMNHEVSRKSVCTFLSNLEDRHRQTDTATLYNDA